MARLILMLTLLTVATAPTLAGQDAPSPLETDRPDYTEASSVVGSGRVQLEGGWTHSRPRGDVAAGEHSWPEVLARVGITPSIELRLGLGFVSIKPPGGGGYTAFEDVYVGTKIAVREQRGAAPQLAVMLQATLPAGDARVTSDMVLPGAAILAGWSTTGRVSYAAALQVNRLPVRGIEIAPSLAAGLQISGALKAYGEWFALVPSNGAPGVDTQQYINGGLALGLGPDLQLDARVGAGIGDAADRVFFGLGASVRR